MIAAQKPALLSSATSRLRNWRQPLVGLAMSSTVVHDNFIRQRQALSKRLTSSDASATPG
jgi:hypothetical protein